MIDGLIKEGVIVRKSSRTYRNPLLELAKQLHDREVNSEIEKQDHVLNTCQKRCVEEVCNDYDRGERKTYLLHGVTGSGKTEVYIRLMEHVIASGKQGILLIPEIALTHQNVMRFYRHFGESVSVLNSRMSEGER